MASPDRFLIKDFLPAIHGWGTASTCPSSKMLALLPADYNCRGDDANDCIKIQEVDEKLFFTKTP